MQRRYLIPLSQDDFSVSRPPGEEPSLRVSLRGFALVLFFSTRCNWSMDFRKTVFDKLPDYIRGCHFAVLDVGKHWGVVERSKATSTPVSSVPMVMCYVHGRPYMQYAGERSVEAIQEFMQHVCASVKQKRTYVRAPPRRAPAPARIPGQAPRGAARPPPLRPPSKGVAHTRQNFPVFTESWADHPLCGEDHVCYLPYNEAYAAQHFPSRPARR